MFTLSLNRWRTSVFQVYEVKSLCNWPYDQINLFKNQYRAGFFDLPKNDFVKKKHPNFMKFWKYGPNCVYLIILSIFDHYNVIMGLRTLNRQQGIFFIWSYLCLYSNPSLIKNALFNFFWNFRKMTSLWHKPKLPNKGSQQS